MRFKIDENLPDDFAARLRAAGHDAMTVEDEGLEGHVDESIVEACLREDRIVLTLDLGFGNIKTYPPANHPGFIVFRLASQDKASLLAALDRLLPDLSQETHGHKLCIVEDGRMRLRD